MRPPEKSLFLSSAAGTPFGKCDPPPFSGPCLGVHVTLPAECDHLPTWVSAGRW